jgi:hypothetical protein
MESAHFVPPVFLHHTEFVMSHPYVLNLQSQNIVQLTHITHLKGNYNAQNDETKGSIEFLQKNPVVAAVVCMESVQP